MSPLIDVTNTALGVQVESSNLRTRKQLRSCPKGRDANSESQVGKSDLHEVAVKDETVAIRMCNTLSAGPASTSRDCLGSSSGNQCSTGMGLPRVPPLPQTADVLLSQAVQALSLSPLNTQTRPRSRRRLNKHKGSIQEHNEQQSNTVVSSNSGLPESSPNNNEVSAPKQCGACGMEFTSMPVLTQHLVRHVYDGLYAAQWLTQAMDLVSNRQPSEGTSSVDYNDEQDVSQVPFNSQSSATGH